MKVVFLDIDGVLNSARTPNPREFPYVVDKRLLRNLKRLIQQSGAKIVLSSTWRVDPIGLYAAKYWGIPFIGICPDRPNSPRRNEIRGWLSKHPRVTRYIVIDDEDDELDGLPLFQPSPRHGLTMDVVKAAALYLNGETDDVLRANVVKRTVQNLTSVFKRSKS